MESGRIVPSNASDSVGDRIEVVDDLDGDGVRDFLVGSLFSPSEVRVHSGWDGSLIRIHAIGGSVYSYELELLDDVDGDGVRDYAIADPGFDLVSIVSGASGSQLRLLTPQGVDQFGKQVEDYEDVDGDGVREILVSVTDPGEVHVFSPVTGAPLQYYAWPGAPSDDWGHALAVLDDLDEDGRREIAVSAVYADHGTIQGAGVVQVVSATTGQILYEFAGLEAAQRIGDRLMEVPDLDGDGLRDLVHVGTNGGPFDTRISVHSPARGSLLYRAEDPYRISQRGNGLAALPDLDGDGVPEFMVCSVVYSGRDGRVLHDFEEPGGQQFPPRFGEAVGAYDGGRFPGALTVLIGAPRWDAPTASDSGAVFAFQLYPGLRASTPRISATNGGIVDFAVRFPASFGSSPYAVLVSGQPAGVSSFGGETLPIVADSWTLRAAQNPPTWFASSRGRLDAGGASRTRLMAAPGQFLPLLGRTLRFTAACDVAGSEAAASFSIPLTVTP